MATHAHPLAIASIRAFGKPSTVDGNTNTDARRYSDSTSRVEPGITTEEVTPNSATSADRLARNDPSPTNRNIQPRSRADDWAHASISMR